MRYLLVSFLMLIHFSIAQAQHLRAKADTQAVMRAVQFPQANANMIISFTANMLNLDEIPAEKEQVDSLPVLLEKLEKDEYDIDLLIDIYYAYFDQDEEDKGFTYLRRAYNRAVELYDQNPSNMDLLEKITEMMILVKRTGDIPTLWRGYTKRNPEVAQGWAKLAFYEVQVLDTLARLHIERAYALDPSLPDIYLAAIMNSLFDLLLQMRGLSEDAENEELFALEMNLDFLKRAAAENPKLEIAQLSLETAKLVEVFYEVLISNVDNISEQKKKGLQLNKDQKTALAELEKYFQSALKKKKVKNKFFPLKGLVVVEVLRGNLDMAKAYMLESQKYIKHDVDLYKIIAFGYLPVRRYDKATELLQEAVDISPTYDDLFALARLYFENYEYDKSFEILKELSQSFPGKMEVIYGLVSIYMRKGDFTMACMTIDRMKSLYQGEYDFEKDDYGLFYEAVCGLVNGDDKASLKRLMETVVEKDLPWAEEMEKLMNRFL